MHNTLCVPSSERFEFFVGKAMQIFKHITANSIALEPFDFHRELSMEAYLIENEQILSLDLDGFKNPVIICDELTLKNTRNEGKTDGRIDILVSYNESEYFGLVELKKGEVSVQNIDQLRDSLNRHQDIVVENSVLDAVPEAKNYKWIGMLVGTSISEELRKKILDGERIVLDSGVEVPLAALVIKRYKSNDGQVFVTTDSYANLKLSNKDFSKFIFENNRYAKNRLVLEVIRHYVSAHPDIAFAQLKNIFPDTIHPAFGIFQTVEDIKDMKESYHKRYFIKENEVILVDGVLIAVCNQWGGDVHKKFVEHAKALGLKIVLG